MNFLSQTPSTSLVSKRPSRVNGVYSDLRLRSGGSGLPGPGTSQAVMSATRFCVIPYFEAAIPFKSLRYKPGRAQVWGINLARHVKNAEKNEISYLVPIPPAIEA